MRGQFQILSLLLIYVGIGTNIWINHRASKHIPDLCRDSCDFPLAPNLCRDSNLCWDKSKNHICIFQIYIEVFYLCRDRLGANVKSRTIPIQIRNMCVYFCVLFPHMPLFLHRLGLGMTTLSQHILGLSVNVISPHPNIILSRDRQNAPKRFEICIYVSVIYTDIGYYPYIDEEHAENQNYPYIDQEYVWMCL